MEKDKLKIYYDEVFNGLNHTLNNAAKQIAIESDLTSNEDTEALNNLNRVIEMCLIVQEVYVNGNKNIHPTYALEKLNRAKYSLEMTISHFRKEEINDEEE